MQINSPLNNSKRKLLFLSSPLVLLCVYIFSRVFIFHSLGICILCTETLLITFFLLLKIHSFYINITFHCERGKSSFMLYSNAHLTLDSNKNLHSTQSNIFFFFFNLFNISTKSSLALLHSLHFICSLLFFGTFYTTTHYTFTHV